MSAVCLGISLWPVKAPYQTKRVRWDIVTRFHYCHSPLVFDFQGQLWNSGLCVTEISYTSKLKAGRQQGWCVHTSRAVQKCLDIRPRLHMTTCKQDKSGLNMIQQKQLPLKENCPRPYVFTFSARWQSGMSKQHRKAKGGQEGRRKWRWGWSNIPAYINLSPETEKLSFPFSSSILSFNVFTCEKRCWNIFCSLFYELCKNDSALCVPKVQSVNSTSCYCHRKTERLNASS